ncbi:MAG TPA: hypothetical protein VM223_22650 [Planctomycetota bacterium]|nr:hypothetical protein [Planctomycetota bacterium]
MTKLTLYALVLLFSAAIVPAGFGEAKDPGVLQMAAVPDDGVIRLADYGYRDWGPELVRYRIDAGRFQPGKLVLTGPDGAAVPFQVEGGVLSFVAELKKGQSVSYTLAAADNDRSAENSTLVQKPAGDAVEVGNAAFSIRLPKPQEKTFDQPASAAGVPPPILAWKQQGFDWLGGARFVTDRKVRSMQVKCVANGPAAVTYEARYRFAPSGEYLWRITVCDRLPWAMVTEEFDFGAITDGRDFLMLGLGESWQPGEVGWVDNGTLKREPAADYLKRKAEEQNKAVSNVSSYDPPPPDAPGKGLVLLEKISATGSWGPRGAIELRSTPKDAAPQAFWVCPMHVGAWRRAMSLLAWNDPARGVEVALPVSVRHSRWYLDLADDRSPFSTHEHDPGLPASYGRRVWAFGFGDADPISVRMDSGYIGLDRYKDWVIDWPEDTEKAKYPRAFTTMDLLGRLLTCLDNHPEKALLERLFIINGRKESAIENAQGVLRTMQAPYSSSWSLFGFPGYNETYFRLGWAVQLEDALACPDLPPDLRREVRRHVALWAHFYGEPDYDPRFSGVHLGNPNMPIGRSIAIVPFAALLPDHPMYDYWMMQAKVWAEERLAICTSPDGAWFEPPTYQMYGPTRALTIAQIILRNTGYGDLAKLGYHARALVYDANLTMPDARYKGWRILPGMGNSGNTLEGVWGMGAGVVELADPEMAGFFLFMHRLGSGNRRVSQGGTAEYSFFLPCDIAERRVPLRTTFTPGYGVSFRAHFGSPFETAMLFRCGYNKSHWDTDDQNVVLYGKGAPLSPGTGYQYYYGPASKDNAICHNRCKPGSPAAREPFGRVETAIQDYGFGENADYAVGREYYPPQYFEDGKTELEWRRHVIFLKSRSPEGANYFVMRDTFITPDGKPAPNRALPTWWHWLNLGTADRISVDGKALDAAALTLNEIVPDAKAPALRGQTLDLATDFGASTRIWFASPRKAEVRATMTFDYQMAPNYHHRTFGKDLGVTSADEKETKTRIRIESPAGEGFLYVVYPRKDGEPAPECGMTAFGCIKVVTPESTDYVFLNDSPVDVSGEGVVFAGKSGAVRIFKDRVALCLNAGSGRVGYKGCVLKGSGPFESTIALADLKPGERDMGGTEKKIVTVDLGRGVSVRGELPFDAKLDGDSIRIKTSGRARVLHVTLPDFIIRPDLMVDGQRWMPGWTDYASSDWGRMKNSYLASVSTLDGDHELVIRDMVFPASQARQFVPGIGTKR